MNEHGMKTGLGKIARENATLIALLGLGILLSLTSETFFSPNNLTKLILQYADIGILAVGMTMVILIGGIDLSVGSIVFLSGVIAAYLLRASVAPLPAILIAFTGSGVLLGLWNGFWIAKFKIPPFIITLGMMIIAKGAGLFISNQQAITVSNDLFHGIGHGSLSTSVTWGVFGLLFGLLVFALVRELRQIRKHGLQKSALQLWLKYAVLAGFLTLLAWVFAGFRGLPWSVIVYGVVIAAGIFTLRKTRFGRRLYAIGGNEEAARLSGINIFRTKLAVYSLMTALAALAGLITASRVGGAETTNGQLYELDAIAAVVIGGTSLSGGSGTVTGTVIGTFIIGLLNNGMDSLGLTNDAYRYMVKGMIIIFAVWFDIHNRRKKG